jgi:hypothetical protein
MVSLEHAADHPLAVPDFNHRKRLRHSQAVGCFGEGACIVLGLNPTFSRNLVVLVQYVAAVLGQWIIPSAV